MSVIGSLFENWHCWPERAAVETPEGDSLTYAELAERADGFFPQPGDSRELLLLLADNSLVSLVAYVAALRTGRVVMLQPATIAGEKLQTLLQCYQPDWLFDPRSMTFPQRLYSTPDPIHPALAVLLSTSGSTGSPKLVRLSQHNIYSNAASIAEYLGLNADERPLAHLPLSYSYGLSVVNSHLLVGATLLLTADSMMERRFWQFCRERRATSLSGVPYHYEMLERLRFQRMNLPDLSTLTQAGGRLAPEKVVHWGRWCLEQGKTFIPMYGQTEATARISYLPSEKVLGHPECIGVPIPGGQLRLRDDEGGDVLTPDTPGELVYEGPNVMLGYAQSRLELSKGAEVEVLQTGDLACVNDSGLFYIVGRLKRFIKLFGLRVSLDELEQTLKAIGVTAVCFGADQVLRVAIVTDQEAEDIERVQNWLRHEGGWHPSVWQVCAVAEVPRTASGKINYPELERLFDD
ncbi:MAG: AMP-binding protein [Oceanospirillales bacterium]|nr:AMP-binding protein [Oceanospirillales bacterium]